MKVIESWLSTKAIVLMAILALVFSLTTGATSACATTSTGPIHTVVFTAVGAGQLPNEYNYLEGAQFNLYKYSGSSSSDLTEDSINSIDLASTNSTQWEPIIAADGTLGEAGNGANEPYKFGVSSSGEVSLPMESNVYYMLVEVATGNGYQVPQGQWAIKAIASGSGYQIDPTTVLAHAGSDGSQPPALATTLNVGGAETTGVFVVNTVAFNPLAIGGIVLLLVVVALAVVFALRFIRRKHEGSNSNDSDSNNSEQGKPWWVEATQTN